MELENSCRRHFGATRLQLWHRSVFRQRAVLSVNGIWQKARLPLRSVYSGISAPIVPLCLGHSLTAGYLLPVTVHGFLPGRDWQAVHSAQTAPEKEPVGMLVPLLVLAALAALARSVSESGHFLCHRSCGDAFIRGERDESDHSDCDCAAPGSWGCTDSAASISQPTTDADLY